jgi:tetratricopeptide (TPR) repeat protein
MRWLQTEYILKGLYLGLLLFVALHEPDWAAFGLVNLLAFGGLVLFLGIAAFRKMQEGFRAQGKPLAFVLFLLLESPELVYGGVLLGMAVAAFMVSGSPPDSEVLAAMAGGGAVLGVLFWVLRYVQNRWARFGLSLLLAAVLMAAALLWFGPLADWGRQLGLANPLLERDVTIFAVQLLVGVALFYLLTFAGREEESEVEIGATCAILGMGMVMLLPRAAGFQSLGVLIPLLLDIWYTTRVLPGLRVFKHALRGFSYYKIGRYRNALLSFRRALQLAPDNTLAREGLWSVHRAMDLSQLPNDPQTLALVDLDMCLGRVAALLLEAGPGETKLHEARRLLDLVLSQRPSMAPVVHYWRAVAFTHERRYDEAADELQQLLDPTGYAPHDPQRRSMLLQGWQLALRSRPELAQRVGTQQLALPGRRMEAIGAVERHLANNPEDAEVWGFKRSLYQDLTEADYEGREARGERREEGQAAFLAPRPSALAPDFDHGYVHQLGLALIGDPPRWQRGAEYLRMAARGMPASGPSIFTQIAQAHQRQGDAEGAWRNYELAKRAGRLVGPKNLGDEERQTYFAAVKLLAESAAAHNDVDAAVENYHLYAESTQSGLETLRILTDLYERKGDALGALRVTEQALLYNAKDKDLLARKDRYYYSIMPGDLRARREMVGSWFDVAYCLRKAKTLLDLKNWDLDTLDWAQHLAELARVMKPEDLAGKVLMARARLRRGEKEEAVALLEQVRSPKPEQFATGEDEEAWYVASRLLGEMYLYELGKPDLAVECFKDFRHSSKSGADTLYKLGQAYEQLGDRPRAVKFYKHVAAYEGHPLAHEANDALYRLQAS